VPKPWPAPKKIARRARLAWCSASVDQRFAETRTHHKGKRHKYVGEEGCQRCQGPTAFSLPLTCDDFRHVLFSRVALRSCSIGFGNGRAPSTLTTIMSHRVPPCAWPAVDRPVLPVQDPLSTRCGDIGHVEPTPVLWYRRRPRRNARPSAERARAGELALARSSCGVGALAPSRTRETALRRPTRPTAGWKRTVTQTE
jgi:hypothetical protein